MRPFRSDDDGDTPDALATFRDDDGCWNIADVAEAVASTPSDYLDDILIDDDGNAVTVDPERSRVREASVRIGGAAADTTTAAYLRDAGQHHGDGVWYGAAHAARLPEDDSAALDVRFFDACLSWLRMMPWASRPKHAKMLSLLAKPMFLLGDLAVIFNILYKSGSNQVAAALTGVSAATGAIASGTVAGHCTALAFQRERRGPKPDEVPNGLSDLYADADRSNLGWTMWLVIAGGFAILLGVAVAFVTLAGGYPGNEAVGSGLITSLTVAGSFCAEVYGTNAGADRIEELEERRDIAYGRRAEIGELRADADRALVRAETIRAAGSRQARAALNTAMVVSDPPKTDERVRGYVAAESAERLVVPTPSVDVTPPPSIDRTHPRVARWVGPPPGSATTPSRPLGLGHGLGQPETHIDLTCPDHGNGQETVPLTAPSDGDRPSSGGGT